MLNHFEMEAVHEGGQRTLYAVTAASMEIAMRAVERDSGTKQIDSARRTSTKAGLLRKKWGLPPYQRILFISRDGLTY